MWASEYQDLWAFCLLMLMYLFWQIYVPSLQFSLGSRVHILGKDDYG